MYLDDLSDAELFVRSVPNSNHIAWQLGHLVSSDHEMLTLLGRTPPALPEGFAEAYTNETATSDDPAKFHKKDEYLALMDKMKAAVLALLGTHWLMHAGQFVPIRRQLGRPPLF